MDMDVQFGQAPQRPGDVRQQLHRKPPGLLLHVPWVSGLGFRAWDFEAREGLEECVPTSSLQHHLQHEIGRLRGRARRWQYNFEFCQYLPREPQTLKALNIAENREQQ